MRWTSANMPRGSSLRKVHGNESPLQQGTGKDRQENSITVNAAHTPQHSWQVLATCNLTTSPRLLLTREGLGANTPDAASASDGWDAEGLLVAHCPVPLPHWLAGSRTINSLPRFSVWCWEPDQK